MVDIVLVFGGRFVDKDGANVGKISTEHQKKCLHATHCTLSLVHCTMHPRFITSQARISKQNTHSSYCSRSFYPKPFICLPLLLSSFSAFSTLFHFVWQLSMQCNADFSKGGSMVEIGGVPWIIVEDIFTLTHFRVPFAPLKGAAA